MDEFIFKEEGYKIVGCFYAVYNTLGPGFLEAVYQEALEKEFFKNNIPYVREMKVEIFYKEEKMRKFYKADFICYDKIVIELKAQKYITEADFKQTKNLLTSTNQILGYLVNFGAPKLYFKRIINTV
ncbi:MAG: GxxExxY protein [Paludibacter sp.]